MANSSLCLTPACLQAASNILWQIAPDWDKLDPCTNFERMVCTRFEEGHPDEETFLGLATKQNIRVLREVLELPYSEGVAYQSVPWKNTDVFPRNSIDEANFNLIRKTYETCRDENAIVEAGPVPLQRVLADLNSAWPVKTDDLKTLVGPSDRNGMTKAVIFLEELGLPSLVELNVAPHMFENPKENILFVTGPSPIATNSSIFADPPALKEYEKQIATSLTHYYPSNLSEAAAASIAKGIAQLEGFIYDFAGPPVAKSLLRREMIDIKNLTDVAASIPDFDLLTVIRSLAPPNYKTGHVYTELKEYWSMYPAIYDKFPKTVIQGWLAWRAIAVLSPFTQIPTKGNRRTYCLTHTDTVLKHILGRFFYNARFPQAAKKQIEEVAALIKEQTRLNFNDVGWMSADARDRSAKKAVNMVANVGYRTANPDVRSPESLAAYYKSVNITSSFFSNSLAGMRHEAAKTFASLTEPVDRDLVDFPVFSANAQYLPYFNNINIYSSTLQLPLYHPDLPPYAVFGGVGSVIGHEIFHAFDNNSRHLDEKTVNLPWWDKKTNAEFEKRAQCIVTQYSGYNYSIPGGQTEAVNGAATLNENIADAGGIKVAYNAWKAYSKNKDKPLNLPGLEHFTHEQLFFIFYGSVWCNSYSDEYNDDGWDGQVHAHGSARILGATANSRAFREAFKCKAKEPTCELY